MSRLIRRLTTLATQNMHEKWFAIRTKSNREIPVSKALQSKGYEVLCPRYAARPARIGDAPSRQSRSLFPGYLFCRFDVLVRMPILTIPGVIGVVSNGHIPIPLDDDEVESLKVLVNSKLPIGPHSFLQAGDRVRVSHGPLAGANGYIVRSDSERLVVSITLLQRSVAVELARDWLDASPVKATHAAGAAYL
jgi:transcription antitermination factor NusG